MRQDSQTWMGLKDDVVGKVCETALEHDHRAQRRQEHARLSFEKLRALDGVSDRCDIRILPCVVLVLPCWLFWRMLKAHKRLIVNSVVSNWCWVLCARLLLLVVVCWITVARPLVLEDIL